MTSKFTHIIHLGDIHIRNGNEQSVRLKEYKTVFQNLEKDLQELDSVKNNTALIVVCGDIFHNKNKLEPFAIQLWDLFIKILTNLAPTVLICGNHDFRQESPDTPDLIKVMYETMGTTKHSCHYLEETGNYLFENVEIGLVCIKDTLNTCSTSGLIDELPEFPEPIYEDAVHVALFHGTITQSSLPNGQTIPAGKGYPLEWFNKYDIVMLGDNHKQQLNKSSWGMPWGYPGSLIQQDIGEPVYGHGYLLWNLESKTGTNHHVYNPFGRIKTRMKDNSVQVKLENGPYVPLQTNVHVPWFPKKPNLHIIGSIGDDVPVLQEFHKYNINPSHSQTILSTSKDVFEEESENIDEIIHEISTLNNPEKWLEYLESNDSELASSLKEYQWLENPSKLLMEIVPTNVSSELSSLITKVRTKITDAIENYGKITNQSNANNHKVTLKHMAWEWTFSYGQENWFDFEKMEGHIGILNGPNASGKSSFIDTLCIGLFGEATPNRQMNSSKKISSHYIHSQRPNARNATNAMHVKIMMEVDGQLYEIIRKFVMRQEKNESSALSAEVFTVDKQTKEKQLKVSGTILVNEWVEKYCGTIDDIMKTSIVLQLDNQNFFYAKSEDQKKMIDHAVNLTVLQSFSQIIHEALLGYNNLLKTLSTILNTNLENATEEIIASEEEVQEYTTEFEELVSKIPILEKERDELASIAGDFIKHPPKETFDYWNHAYKETVTLLQGFNIDTKNFKSIYEKRTLLQHLLEELGHTYDKDYIPSESIDKLKADESQILKTIESMKELRPPVTRPIELLLESIEQLDEWFTENEDWISNPDKIDSIKESYRVDMHCHDDIYEDWVTYKIPEPDKNTPSSVKAISDVKDISWKKYIQEYRDTLDKYNQADKNLSLHMNSRVVPDKSMNDYDKWQEKYDKYTTAIEECNENKWPDLEQCKKNYQDTLTYISKRKSLVQECENLKQQLQSTLSSINKYPNWKKDYAIWADKQTYYKNITIDSLDEKINDRQGLYDAIIAIDKKLSDATSKLQELEDDTWSDDYSYWKEKEAKVTKYKWTNKEAILEQISLHEEALVNHRLFTREIELLEKDVKNYENYPFNPSCDACCKNPFYHRKKEIEKELRKMQTKLEQLGEYKTIEKRLAFYKKGLECHNYVENNRETVEKKYIENTKIEKECKDTLQACNMYLEKMPARETIKDSLDDAIREKEAYQLYYQSYDMMDEKYKWLTELDNEKIRIEKLIQRLDKKLEKMENEEQLEITRTYWDNAYQTLSYVETNKEFIEYEKSLWDEILIAIEKYTNWEKTKDTLTKELLDLEKTLAKQQAIAYHAWFGAGAVIKETRAESLQKYNEFMKSIEQLQDKNKIYESLLEEKNRHTQYTSWENKVNIVEARLKKVRKDIYYHDLTVIESELSMLKEYESAKQSYERTSKAIAWYNYQTLKQQLTDMHSRYSILHTLLEQYKRDTRRTSSKSATMTLLHTLFQEWTKRRDILQRLDEKLVNEKGKKTGDSDTFKEWVYAHHVIPLLEKQVNRFLMNIDDIRFRIAYTSKTLLYYVQDRGNETSFGASSGYQQFVIGLAMRQALSTIGGSGNNLQHMFIDEGFTACDAKNLEKTHDVLKLLIDMGHYKSILLVTHLESIKEMVSLKIDIKRPDAFSRLNYGNPYPEFSSNTVKRRGRPKNRTLE